MEELIRLEDLNVSFATTNGYKPIIKGINLSIQPGEIVGLVGESGSGKSVTARSIVRLNDERTLTDYTGAILGESTLSFLGAGIPAPAPSWGNIIQGGRTVIFSQYYIVLFPSIAVLLAVTSLHLLGEGLRDALDPKQLESEEA